jgi:uncharacterized protein YkwD
MSYSRLPVLAESLESRRLMSAVYPTNLEQYMVELINRGRANPTAEASRYGVALNEGLAAGTISTAAKQPLAINPYLEDSSRRHSQWMIDTDTFSHTGASGTHPKDRMAAAGYAFSGTWWWGENIAWQSYTGSSMTTSLANTIHKGLFVDTWVSDRGHRLNLMNPSFREVGVGMASGAFQKYNPVGMMTTDFASQSGNPFLTGVAYKDTVVKDNFYTPGEGLGGVTVTATRTSDNHVFSTRTFSSGGYSLALPTGTYRVAASGGTLSTPITFSTVTIGSQNVKRDFVPTSTITTTTTTPPPTTSGDTAAPTAVLSQANRLNATQRFYSFYVTYSDDRAVNPATFDNSDIVVTGPNGYRQTAIFNSVDSTAPGTPRRVNYVVLGPANGWDRADNGTYTVSLQSGQVADTSGHYAAGKTLGTFGVAIA